MHRLEPAELLGEGDEVDRRPLVELEEAGVVVVPLPPQAHQLALQVLVGGDDFVGGDVQQHLAADRRRLLIGGVLDQPNHAVLEHPNTRHTDLTSSVPLFYSSGEELWLPGGVLEGGLP